LAQVNPIKPLKTMTKAVLHTNDKELVLLIFHDTID